VVASERGREAADRRESAKRRVGEVQKRLDRLRAGAPSTDTDVQDAAEASDAALAYAQRARQTASVAHHQAADAHRRAAERARSTGHVSDAQHHLQQAMDADAAGDADAAALPRPQQE
jgi:hypothetical protein